MTTKKKLWLAVGVLAIVSFAVLLFIPLTTASVTVDLPPPSAAQ